MLIRVQPGRESIVTGGDVTRGKGAGRCQARGWQHPRGACGTFWDTSGKWGVRAWCHSPLHHSPYGGSHHVLAHVPAHPPGWICPQGGDSHWEEGGKGQKVLGKVWGLLLSSLYQWGWKGKLRHSTCQSVVTGHKRPGIALGTELSPPWARTQHPHWMGTLFPAPQISLESPKL